MPEKKLGYVCTFKKHHPDKQTVIKPFAFSQSCRDAMTTYQMIYHVKNCGQAEHTIKWCDTAEQAAWIAKNYCDKFDFKLIDVIPNET